MITMPRPTRQVAPQPTRPVVRGHLAEELLHAPEPSKWEHPLQLPSTPHRRREPATQFTTRLRRHRRHTLVQLGRTAHQHPPAATVETATEGRISLSISAEARERDHSLTLIHLWRILDKVNGRGARLACSSFSGEAVRQVAYMCCNRCANLSGLCDLTCPCARQASAASPAGRTSERCR
jgi:hypothetical protein